MTEKDLVIKWLAFHNLAKNISAQLENALKECDHPISLNEFYSLFILNETEGKALRMSDLSQRLNLSLSATSRMLARFENTCGVIHRHSSPEDKREVHIRLTPLGQQRLKQALEKLSAVLTNYEDKLII